MKNTFSKLLILLLGAVAFTAGFESYYKFRVHKELIQSVF